MKGTVGEAYVEVNFSGVFANTGCMAVGPGVGDTRLAQHTKLCHNGQGSPVPPSRVGQTVRW